MEIWDAYFADGSLANKDLVRGVPIPKKLYHLVSEILVRHTDGDYLLMQRDFGKPNFGGWFEASAGGAALKGENATACAQRELFEETGLYPEKLTQIGQYTSDDTLYFQFLCITDCDKAAITLQKGETISYKWVNEKAFIAFVNSSGAIPSQKERYYPYFVKKGYIR